jgi:hypothetical protein
VNVVPTAVRQGRDFLSRDVSGAKAFLEQLQHPERGRAVAEDTKVAYVESEGQQCMGIQYQSSVLVVYLDDGNVILYSGEDRTEKVKNRLNRFSPAMVGSRQRRWFIGSDPNQPAFKDAVVVNQQGHVVRYSDDVPLSTLRGPVYTRRRRSRLGALHVPADTHDGVRHRIEHEPDDGAFDAMHWAAKADEEIEAWRVFVNELCASRRETR